MQTISLKGVTKLLSSSNKSKSAAVAVVLLLTLSAVAAVLPSVLPAASAVTAVSDRKTYAYLSVNPHLIGLRQELLVGLWVFPPPSDPTMFAQAEGMRYDNVTITFTKPDGTTDSFMPQEGYGVLPPGRTDRLGGIWFLYKPDQIGTWSVKFSFPGQTYVALDASVYFTPSSSPITTFTVQQDLVRIGFPPVPLPTAYWERPVNADNREWYQISGDWLQPYYDAYGTFGGTAFNPYSTAPNSAHIVWTRQVSLGGIIGGDWGSLSYGAGGGTPTIIMAGKLYNNDAGSSPATFSCVDLRTGEKLWTMPGSITFGQHLRLQPGATTAEQIATTATRAYLWSLATTEWKQYDAVTGVLLRTITNVPPGATAKARFSDGSEIVYAPQVSGFNTTIPNRYAVNRVIKWNLTMVPTSGTGANDWTKGVMWNVSMMQPASGTIPAWAPGDGRQSHTLYIVGDYAVYTAHSGEDRFVGIDLKTGTQLWSKIVDYLAIGLNSWGRNPNGPYLQYDSSRTLYAYDLKTGAELWRTVVGEYPWGVDTQRAVGVLAYGNDYLGGYDGHMYAVDLATGKIKWVSDSTGTTTETPYGNWAYYASFAGADGKIYAATSEHSPTQPRIRGNKLFCLDAYTGKYLWNVSGPLANLVIADGYLIGTSENDGIQYCFGKGKTATTVTAPTSVVPVGTGVLIQGSVMDMSPAAPNTPAVSDADMSEWMDYLHMQKATLINAPPTPHGVSVSLTAVGPNGTVVDIGTVTSDGSGMFKKMWKPELEGEYTIYATFAGSDSYWASYAETGLGVSAAPATTTSEPTTAAPDNTAIIIGTGIAVIIAVAIVGMLLLRKRP